MLAAERFFGSGKSKLLPAAKLLQCERTANLQKSGFKRPDIGGLHGSGRANALNVKLLLQLRHCKNAQAAGSFYRLQKRSRAEKAAFPGQAQGQLHAVIAGGNTALQADVVLCGAASQNFAQGAARKIQAQRQAADLRQRKRGGLWA